MPWRLRRPCTIWEWRGVSSSNGLPWRGGSSSLTVLSLSSDLERSPSGPSWRSLPLPGYPYVLVIGPQQDPDATATLRTACAGPVPHPSKSAGHIAGHGLDDDADAPAGCRADGRRRGRGRPEPRMPDTMRTTATRAGSLRRRGDREQLARVAVAAAPTAARSPGSSSRTQIRPTTPPAVSAAGPADSTEAAYAPEGHDRRRSDGE